MRLIDETGGTPGVRDLGMLQAAVARPQATYGDADLYPDAFEKAAALMHSLILNHPMVDGNKRLSVSAAAVFLERNGYRLAATNEEVEAFTLRAAQGLEDVDALAAWLRRNSQFRI